MPSRGKAIVLGAYCDIAYISCVLIYMFALTVIVCYQIFFVNIDVVDLNGKLSDQYQCIANLSVVGLNNSVLQTTTVNKTGVE